MRTFVYALGLAMSVALAYGSALADDAPRGPGGGGNKGGNMSGNVGGGNVGANVERGGNRGDRGNVGVNVDPGRMGVNVDGNRGDRGNVGVNVDRGRVGVDVDRNRGGERMRLGDRDYDRHGIGRLDDSRFRGRNDNRWRFSHWHNQWWYWMPTGYWMVWDGGRWNRYDEGSYVDNYYTEQQPIASNASGPYYEDQNGFFYYEGNRKVYDPQIRRVENSLGRAPVQEGPAQR